MADLPLRTATDRSLGAPLPYQLANLTQAHLIAPAKASFNPQVLCGISSRFPLLSPTIGRFLRVTHPSATNNNLQANYYPVRLACVKHTTSVQSDSNIINTTELNAICFLTKLKTLKLNNLTYLQSGAVLAATFANITRNLNNLTRLEIRGNVLPIEFSINFIRTLSSINTLKELDLSEAGIDTEEIFELSDISSLEHLNLSHNQMSSDIIELLGES